jgi:hypothetical protein
MMACKKDLQSNPSIGKFQSSVCGLILLLTTSLYLSGFAWSSEMSVVSDEGTAQPALQNNSAEKRPQAGNGAERQESTSSVKAEDEVANRILRKREDAIKRLAPALEEEERLMRQVVQPLDRDAAAKWMAQFISSPPLNCPLKQQQDWIEAILGAVERNQIPICKEILALTASIISIESGFRADPLAIDPSRGEDMTSLLKRAENDFCQKFSTLLSIPPVPTVYDSYKEKYYARLLGCHTEGQIEVVARKVAEDLKKDSEHLPEVIRKVIDKELDKLTNVVRTKGSMQLNFTRARQVMKDRGEQFSDAELSDYMYRMEGGVDVGVAALKPMFVQYAARYAVKDNLSWLFLVGMDYHYGPFSSRNMMEQIRIRDLSGRKIAIDGDFLHYDEKGRPEGHDSETLRATMTFFPERPRDWIIDSFLLEKDRHYIYTDLHKTIAARHRDRFGETPFAVVGELSMGKQAQIKHGVTWKTRSYLNKLDKYLNSVQWDR